MKAFIPLLCLPLFLYSYTLEELVEVSHQNRVIEAATHGVHAKEKMYESTKSSYLPTVEIGGTYQNTYEETPAMAKNSLRAQASLRYTIYDGGKRGALYDQLLMNVDAQKESLEALKNTISLDVTRLYFEYLSLNADKEATHQEITQLQAELERLEMFYKTGAVTRDEVDKIDSRLKSANVALHEIELAIQTVVHTLEYYTVQEVQSIEAGSSLRMPEIDAAEMRPDIKALELEAQSVMYEAQTKKSGNYPSIFFDNTLSRSEYYFDDKSKESTFLVDTQNIATINVAWNILDFGATDKSYEAKQYEYLSKKASLEHEKNKAEVDYRLAKKAYEIAKLKIEATKATLDATSATYELIKLKYQNGTIDNVAYLQALSEKYDAQRGFERAKNDLEVKKAEVLFYGGQTIKEFF